MVGDISEERIGLKWGWVYDQVDAAAAGASSLQKIQTVNFIFTDSLGLFHKQCINHRVLETTSPSFPRSSLEGMVKVASSSEEQPLTFEEEDAIAPYAWMLMA